MRICAISLVMALGVLTASPTAIADVEADPNRQYLLTPENGPWMIFVASFWDSDNALGAIQNGPTAAQLAHDLVLELRREHGIEAYVRAQRPDFGEPDVVRRDPYGNIVRTRYQQEPRTQYAVLAGNFDSAEDRDAQRLLDQIKELRPQCLANLPYGRGFGNGRGPLSRAFLTRNEMNPATQARRSLDPLVLELNAETPFSLLNAPGHYTLVVKTFTGAAVLDTSQNDYRRLQEFDRRFEEMSQLEQAGEQAEQLAVRLRQMGYEAYTYHDRYSSLVTVGSYLQAGRYEMVPVQTADGRTTARLQWQGDEQLHRVFDIFSALQPDGTIGQPKALGSLEFDPVPMLMPIPRR